MDTTHYFIELNDAQLPAIRLPINVRKHRTSRRMIVRYQPLRRCISLTLPRYVSIKQGLHFVAEKRAWILQQVMQFSCENHFADGQVIPLLGHAVTLKHVGGRGLVSEQEHELHVHGDAAFMARRVSDYLKKKLRMEIHKLAVGYAEKIDVTLGVITLRDTSSRWGSCSAGGNLSFSWRLVFAPREVLEYVVAHEVAHIAEHNHSAAFWAVVARLYPCWETHRDWLKTHGAGLYKFG